MAALEDGLMSLRSLSSPGFTPDLQGFPDLDLTALPVARGNLEIMALSRLGRKEIIF